MNWQSSGRDFEGKQLGPGRRNGGAAQWSRYGAGGMSCGEEAASQLENNQDKEEQQASSSVSAAQQNVFREVFDERSEPSDTGEGCGVMQCGEDP